MEWYQKAENSIKGAKHQRCFLSDYSDSSISSWLTQQAAKQNYCENVINGLLYTEENRCVSPVIGCSQQHEWVKC